MVPLKQELKMIAKVSTTLPSDWATLEDALSPFTDARHLSALETTGCLGDATGWYPCHITVHDGDHCIAGLPLYLKTNSYGEFIFDHMWASAISRTGQPYFPKLVSAVPFTPATSCRTLFNASATEDQRQAAQKMICEKISELSKQASSHHVLFLPKNETRSWEQAGYCTRTSFQYHWENLGWTSFEDFLESLVSKRRRQIVLERKQLSQVEGLKIHTATGEQLTPVLADFMYDLYRDTNEKMGSHVCLTRGFFEQTFQTMKNCTVLFYATLNEKPLAAAINYQKGTNLFGRYWGTLQDVRNLHFDLCYYRALDHCFENKLLRYEAGAQGEHKFPRGFLPQFTYSCHKLFNENFQGAIKDFCGHERKKIEGMFAEYAQHSPYRNIQSES
jgi:uncharacterized protein